MMRVIGEKRRIYIRHEEEMRVSGMIAEAIDALYICSMSYLQLCSPVYIDLCCSNATNTMVVVGGHQCASYPMHFTTPLCFLFYSIAS